MSMTPTAVPMPAEAQGTFVDSPRAWYSLGLLTLSFALAYVDRQMLNLLVDPIKQSLGITDTEFSFIQGTAFVVAYLCATPILGRLVDLGNRRAILIFGVCCWSVCTALAGLADTYGELFLTRIGVGLSEACVFPVSMSLIGDTFSARRMPRATSIFSLGSMLGSGFSLVGSGLVVAFAASLPNTFPWLRGFETWQMAFIVIGIPGLLYTLVLLTLLDPRRANRSGVPAPVGDRMSFAQVLTVLRGQRRFYVGIYLAIGLIGIIQLGIPSWFPSYLIRSYGMDRAITGYRLGAVGAIFGSLGPLTGPIFSDVLARRGHVDAPLRAAAFCTVGMLFSAVFITLATTTTQALATAAGLLFFSGMTLGIITAAIQNATPARMRGITGSLFTFSVQTIGYMIGPTLVALITDKVFGDPHMVGYSLQIVFCVASLGAGVALVRVLPHYRSILARREEAVAAEQA